jgi:hypothetical protein
MALTNAEKQARYRERHVVNGIKTHGRGHVRAYLVPSRSKPMPAAAAALQVVRASSQTKPCPQWRGSCRTGIA